ncbi:RCC1 repeat-containing protein [Myxococcus stipitatus DSM 14675]|uniref:RCC1 repeat-containing protein n=1 Tax=Myxococcus stipitatus (strain DSM 14675 / JCM 12634 / Mx s8) TaxID=1278073 RepID=L7UIQ0_MYXSD|nr:Ig-like domain-containing protein [Myxococcus stipitatus]AGC48846.1 RCC1 repeat-containing protein [Myxococcus stipitatus DSM 14675]
MKSRVYAVALVSPWLAACGSDVEGSPGTPVVPFVQVASPVSGASVDEPVVRLSGQVTAPGTLAKLTVRVNGGQPRPVEVAASVYNVSTFAVELTLAEGDNEVTFDAEDQGGGTSVQSVRLTFTPETQAPRIQVLSPTAGLAVSARRVRVELTASDNKGVTGLTYSLNGGAEETLSLPASAEDILSFDVTPRAGANELVVRARDARGNVGTSTVGFHLGGLSTAGGLHSGALRDGRVYAWGRNTRGQLGLGAGSAAYSNVPQLVPGLEGVVSIAFNQSFSMALDASGAVWTWGENSEGQLGHGTPPEPGQPQTPGASLSDSPARVPGLTGAVAIAAGYSHGLVLMEDGTVRAFGANDEGQLGDGTTTSRNYALPVPGVTDAVKVVAGSAHSAVLKRDGTVWVWGRNTYGNLGTGTAGKPGRPSADVVPGLANVVDIANGRDHFFAVHADGTVSTWGLGASGQLGNGLKGVGVQSATPVKAHGVTDARAVFANGNYGFARRADGSLLAWGQNGNGQLGVSDKADRVEPTPSSTQVSPLSSMGMGATHVVAVRGDGSVYAWGWNLEGSLGPSGIIDRWSYTDPIPVSLP